MNHGVVVESACAVPAGGPVPGPVHPGHARARWTERRGIILCVRDREGRLGVGEASPLPGHSPDSLDECEATLRAFAPSGSAITLETISDIAAQTSAPAARFAMETALLDLMGQDTGRPVFELLGETVPWSARVQPERVPLNALVSELADARAAMIQAYERGIRCFKIKIGASFAEEQALLRWVRDRHGHDVAIRLDANRAWSGREAAEKLACLAEIAPEYVEEPCPVTDLSALTHVQGQVPLALDESLVSPAAIDDTWLDELLARGVVRALILKPMLLGGLFRCLELAARARAHGAKAVVSHLFDGPIALAACSQLALVLGETCGLDRHAGLACWPGVDLPWIERSHIRHPAMPGLGLDAAMLLAQIGKDA